MEAKAIRKHAAQHDLFNRIHSIASDEGFVRQVAEKWYNGRFEVVRSFRLSLSLKGGMACSQADAT